MSESYCQEVNRERNDDCGKQYKPPEILIQDGEGIEARTVNSLLQIKGLCKSPPVDLTRLFYLTFCASSSILLTSASVNSLHPRRSLCGTS